MDFFFTLFSLNGMTNFNLRGVVRYVLIVRVTLGCIKK